MVTDQKDFIIQSFQELGWSLNFEKCDLSESTEKTFVGFKISTNRPEGPWISVLPSKIHKLRRAITKCLQAEKIQQDNLRESLDNVFL